jgi:hypothetical protein
MYDEGGDFNKRGSLTAFNMQLNRIFDTYRAFQFVPIICLPNAGVVDRELYVKGVPRMIIHCEKRTAKQGTYRVYGLWRFMWVLQKMQKAPVPQQAYMKTRPNFYGQFLDLPEARRKELELISTQGKKDIITNNVLKNRGLISVGDMARRLSISKPHLNRMIRDNGIKAESEYKKVRYFSTHTINLISEQLTRK